MTTAETVPAAPVDARDGGWRAAGAVFAVAVVVRLLFIAAVPGWDLDTADVHSDSRNYHQLADSLSEGTGYAEPWEGSGPERGTLQPTAFRAPLWPATLSLLYRVTGPSPFAGRLLVVGLDALVCALVVLLGVRLAGPRAGLVAGGLAAVYPPLLVNVTLLMSESAFIVVELLALLAADRFRRSPRPAHAALLGALLGLLALARPNGLVLVVPLAVWVAFAARRDGRRAALRSAAVCAGVAALVVVPWVVRTAVRVDRLVPVTTTSGTVVGGGFSSALVDRSTPIWGGWDAELTLRVLRESPDEATFDRRMLELGWDWIREHPGSSLRIVGYHFLRYFDLYWEMDGRRQTLTPTEWTGMNIAVVLAWWAAAALAVAGIVTLRARWEPWAPVLVAIAALSASGVLLTYATRYRAPVEPLVLLLAAVAVVGRVTASTRSSTATT